MSSKERYITFWTPTMQRTGSEIVLFNLLSHISNKYFFKLISVYKGDLLNLLNKKHVSTFIHKKRPDSIISKVWFKLKEFFFVKWLLYKSKKTIWYINTIVLWDYLEYAEKNKVKVMLHVHELEQIFSILSKEQLQRVINYPSVIIANSNCTKKLLEKYGRIKPIELCYPAIDTNKITSNEVMKKTYRNKLTIKDNQFVWVMCGTLDDNKNPKLFIDIACELLKIEKDAIFMWIGSSHDTAYVIECKQYAEQRNIKDNMMWIDNTEEYLNYFNCADGFVLTSNKESFSLVTLEALLLGLPVVVNDCGGVKEILREDVGTIVKEINNVPEFVEAMSLYMNNRTLFDKSKGKERAKEFDITIWSKKWNEILDLHTN